MPFASILIFVPPTVPFISASPAASISTTPPEIEPFMFAVSVEFIVTEVDPVTLFVLTPLPLM